MLELAQGDTRMSARPGLRTWLTLWALVVILMFATVAADAKLQGTRPPSSLALTIDRTAAPSCRDGQICRKGPVRKAAGQRGDACPSLRFPTL
jgi:hypothetical protein